MSDSSSSTRFSMIELDDVLPPAPVVTRPAAPVVAAAVVASASVPALTVHTKEANGRAFGSDSDALTARASGKVRSASDLLAAADLAWDPVFAPLTTADGTPIPASIGRAVVRSDTRAPLGIVGDRYELLPHAQSFAALADALRQSAGPDSLYFGNAGHKRGGASPFLQLRTSPEKVGRVEAELMISLFTDHTGRMNYTIGFSTVVVICRNTHKMALRDARNGLKIKHTASGPALLTQAESILGAAGQYAGAWSNTALRMMGEKMTDDSMVRLASHLVPGESKRSENARGELMRAWTDAPGAAPGTVWGAAQAVTYYTSHAFGSDATREDLSIFGAGGGADIQASAWMILDAAEDVRERALQTVTVRAF